MSNALPTIPPRRARIGLRLSDAERAALARAAERRGVRVSDLVRQAILALVQEQS